MKGQTTFESFNFFKLSQDDHSEVEFSASEPRMYYVYFLMNAFIAN